MCMKLLKFWRWEGTAYTFLCCISQRRTQQRIYPSWCKTSSIHPVPWYSVLSIMLSSQEPLIYWLQKRKKKEKNYPRIWSSLKRIEGKGIQHLENDNHVFILFWKKTRKTSRTLFNTRYIFWILNIDHRIPILHT